MPSFSDRPSHSLLPQQIHHFQQRLAMILKPVTTAITPFNTVCARAASVIASSSRTPLARVILKGGRSKLFTEDQSPIVYSKAIDRVVGRPAPTQGDPVLVCNGGEEPVGWGVWNPSSMYRVRIMQTADEIDLTTEMASSAVDMSDILQRRITTAVSLRAALGLPSDATTVFRLLNSEGDRLSGLIADVLGDKIVVSSSAAWVEQHRQQIQRLLLEAMPSMVGIEWRSLAPMMKEEGFEVSPEDGNDGSDQQSKTIQNEQLESSTTSPLHVVKEAGVLYYIDPSGGQKTGFYADQREHRAYVRSIAGGKDVLDVCCYSGGFAISAAAGGAASVLGIDSSAPAIELARQNATANNYQERCGFEVADAAKYMKAAAEEGKQWDMVVLDPPKLAPNRKALTNALRKYTSLNAAAMRLVRPGGLLMTCSCSGAVAQSGSQEFIAMLRGAAKKARRRISVLRVGGAAADHPVDPGYPEGQYLTNVVVSVS
jgi:23S rRNA G2069 N7-methylase RlmK/C1962 C5-methylase RlmI